MKTEEEARTALLGMLEVAGVREKPSYRRHEVCAILGICRRHFQTMVDRFEPDPGTGRPLRPDCLDSYMLRRERRVRFDELVSYMQRNNTYHRKNALDPQQLTLF